ncbi:amidohydrolase family protein [Chloroflexota bacterium]
MTIDIHCHLWKRGFIPEAYLKAIGKALSEWRTQTGNPITLDEMAEKVFPQWWDPDGEHTIRQMDEAGIEKTLLLPIDLGFPPMSEPPISIEEQNKHILGLVKKHPDRLIGFCGVDPRRKNALELFERSVEEWGARGLKFVPFTGFYPDGEEAYSLVEKAAEWNLPLVTHVGPEFPPFYPKYSEPSRLVRILTDFPDLQVIAPHLGMARWRELIEVSKLSQNLTCDVSGLQLGAAASFSRFCHMLRRAIDGFGMHRVMFGTDDPPFTPFVSKKQWVETIKDLPHNAPEGVSFTQEEVDALLHSNAERVLATIP